MDTSTLVAETNPVPANLTRAGIGRPKGVPNRTTRAMRDLIEGALDRIDAETKLVELAESLDPVDRKTFWTIAAKLIPSTLHADVNVTGPHSALTEAAGAVPPHVVAAMLEAGRAAMLKGPPTTGVVIDVPHTETRENAT